MARTVIGDQQVQGLDYAYTLQGWLKGVNGSSLSVGYDMGRDGDTTWLNRYVGRDAYGYNLSYFTGDYTPISSLSTPFPGYSGLIGSLYKPLYNGNISSMVVNIGKFPSPLMYNYTYDQLNRITQMDVDSGFNQSTNTWSSPVNISDYKERIAYDPNGNITKYLRNGTSTVNLNMDSLSYFYNKDGNGRLLNNQLNYIRDEVGGTNENSNYPSDIDDQSANNYSYDSIGNLVKDNAESITSIRWSVYGKILEIQRTATANNPMTDLQYTYDASGNRISKMVTNSSGPVVYTWYARDGQGNVMSTYTSSGTGVYDSLYSLALTEQHLYGSNRLGIWSRNTDMKATYTVPTFLTFQRGYKNYELSNHLGNVLVTISDKKLGVSSNGITTDNFLADLRNANDYYPFGSLEPGRSYSASNNYRYGFNGKENDNEVKGQGNELNYGMRIYDPRAGRFLSIDPLFTGYPNLTPYQFSSNSPIAYIDLDGLEKFSYNIILSESTGQSGLQISHAPYIGGGKLEKQGPRGNGSQFTVYKQENRVINGKVTNTSTELYTVYIPGPKEPTFTDKLLSILPIGDQSKTSEKGYVILGTDTHGGADDQDKLPKAADGSEIIDLGAFASLADGMREGAAPADFLKEGSKLKKVIERVENLTKAVEKIKEAVEVAKKAEMELKGTKILPPGSDSCGNCKKIAPKDSLSRIDHLDVKSTIEEHVSN